MAGDLQGIGSFRLHGVLGRGVSATIYRATREQDAALERAYAVKVLHGGDAAGASRQRARWRMGLRLAPAVLSPLEVGSADGRPFAVYPLVDGCAAARLAEAGGLEPAAAAIVVRGALRALIAGLDARPRQCHGALDDGDVLVDHHGEVWVTGFGVKASVTAEDADLRAIGALARRLCQAWPKRAEGWLRSLEAVRGVGAEAHRALESCPLEVTRPGLEALAQAVDRAGTGAEAEAGAEAGAEAEAEAGAEAAAEAAARDPRVLVNLGRLLLRRKAPALAREALGLAVAAPLPDAPWRRDALELLATACRRAGDPAGQRAALEELTRAFPRHRAGLIALSIVRERLDRAPAQALALARRALALQRDAATERRVARLEARVAREEARAARLAPARRRD